MEAEKNNWFNSYVKKAIESLHKILLEEDLPEKSKTEQIERILNEFLEDITKYIKPTNTDILFYDPLLKLKRELIKKSYMASMEKEFTNWALHVCIQFIDNSPSKEVFSTTFQKYKDYVLYKLGLIGHTRGYFYNGKEFDKLLQILEWNPEEIWKDILLDRDGKKTIELYPYSIPGAITQDENLKNESIKNEIPVVLAADNNYAQPTMVTIASMLQTAEKSTVYHFYLLVSGDFSEKNKKRIIELCSQRTEWKVKFVDMQSAYKNTYIKVPHISTATYYRLQLPSLLSDVNKCIYLDVDLIVKQDLSSLFETDIENQYLAGVRAAGYYATSESLEYHMNRLGIQDFSAYVNAGVLVMNLKRIREDGLEQKFVELIDKEWESQDQDILNVACLGKIRLVNMKYNAMTKYPLDDDKSYDRMNCLKRAYSEYEWEDGRKNPVIIHYADRIKPWTTAGVVYANEWWGVVSQMPMNIAMDIYNSYVSEILTEARQVKQSQDYYVKLYKDVKKQGAFENERIYKYKLQAENRELKKIMEDEKEISEKKILEIMNKQSNLEKRIESLNDQLHDVKQSRSYRIGKICTFIPRKIKRMLLSINHKKK